MAPQPKRGQTTCGQKHVRFTRRSASPDGPLLRRRRRYSIACTPRASRKDELSLSRIGHGTMTQQPKGIPRISNFRGSQRLRNGDGHRRGTVLVACKSIKRKAKEKEKTEESAATNRGGRWRGGVRWDAPLVTRAGFPEVALSCFAPGEPSEESELRRDPSDLRRGEKNQGRRWSPPRDSSYKRLLSIHFWSTFN